ncbi:MAG: hypothetical protein JWN13_651 [Betaproteobacteria bacterium]|jgi:hypothetical protein|nr:hypothetical protein [Betaproteobacteria bacterium]MEA3153976.1 hypothetical protein [Betaproteobacteria bacterium]
MTGLFRIVVAHAFALCMAGCVIQGSTVPTAVVTPLRAKVIPADRVKDAVAIGKSTKADVIASLGETLVISFDTGYEVWVYRLANHTPANAAPAQRIARTGSEKAWPPTPAEFVILFAPSGLVAKTRIRPAP